MNQNNMHRQIYRRMWIAANRSLQQQSQQQNNSQSDSDTEIYCFEKIISCCGYCMF